MTADEPSEMDPTLIMHAIRLAQTERETWREIIHKFDTGGLTIGQVGTILYLSSWVHMTTPDEPTTRLTMHTWRRAIADYDEMLAKRGAA